MDYRQLRFDRSAKTYASHSGIQAQIALKLMDLIPKQFQPKAILELGCGDGNLSVCLQSRFPTAQITFTDTSPQMLECCSTRLGVNPNFKFEILDARNFAPQAVQPFDLICSNAMVQWFPDLGAHLRSVSASLNPQGYHLLSCFAANNFPELNELLAKEPFNRKQFPGHDFEKILQLSKEFGWNEFNGKKDSQVSFFPSVMDFLKGIHSLGASEGSAGFTRGKLQILCQEYERHFSLPDGSIPATWNWWLALIQP